MFTLGGLTAGQAGTEPSELHHLGPGTYVSQAEEVSQRKEMFCEVFPPGSETPSLRATVTMPVFLL